MGPLAGIRIVEIAGIGPGPFCGMMLADHGAEVIRVERLTARLPLRPPEKDILNRSRKAIGIDLKTSEGVELVRRFCRSADGVIEGFRPGVMERLGLGPDVLLGDNPRLVYGRVTGWGQDGPYAQAAGHDINYIALSGALHAIGPAGQKPVVPLNLVGDFGGGGMMLAFGMVAAILRARDSGQGQVVDCAMTEGSALLMAMPYSFRGSGDWDERRGTNVIDGGAPFYDVYQTADAKYVALGAVEPQFFRMLLERIGLADDPDFQAQYDRALWPRQKRRLDAMFRTRTREQWCALLEDSDACFAPVMAMSEAAGHVHNAARRAFVEVDGIIQPAPAPRYARTPCEPPSPSASGAAVAREALAALGYPDEDIQRLLDAGTIG